MYLIVYRPLGSKYSSYDISKSRNAIKHLKDLNAQTVWVYDRNGYWLSFADRDKNGIPYRPTMYPDGEPRLHYAMMYSRLMDMCRYLDGKSSML